MRETNESAEPDAKSAEDSRLIKQLDKNFLCLHRQYRLGGFERNVAYTDEWRPSGDKTGLKIYDLCEYREDVIPQVRAGVITFKAAVKNLYETVLFVEGERPGIATACAILLLKCKCLIYEATDYWLHVPPELGTYFIEHAEMFPYDSAEVARKAERLNGVEFENMDERAKVIKLLLIAALCGINELYRKHGSSSYERALHLLARLDRYIEKELPRQHMQERKSYGLIGLTQYLNGRALSGKGDFIKSRKSFRRSAEAYVARLRQKEEFLRDDNITPQEYEEKLSVTVRRAALVTAFGDGYLSFVSSRLTRALESLTLARAALSRNSGRVYLTYVDMLYWACRRAQHTSNAATIEEIVRELSKCREAFRELVNGSHYFHRAGLQLALALFHRANLSPVGAAADYGEGISYLDEAIAQAGYIKNNEPRNPHLLASALVIKSRFLSSRSLPGKRASAEADRLYLSDLAEAEAAAKQAIGVSAGIREVESEAWATLGNVYMDLAEFYQGRNKDDFNAYFDLSFEALQEALKKNHGENIRIDAVCYLRLTKLCLLDPNTKILAYEYFEQWRKIEGEVEHQYWREMAQKLEGKLGGPTLLVKAWEGVGYEEWEKRLKAFLHEEALKSFVARHEGKDYTEKQLHSRLVVHLRELGYSDNKIYELIEEEELMEKVKMMRARGPEARAKKKLHSYITEPPKPIK